MTGQQETENMAKSTDNNNDGNADPPRDPAWCIVTCKYDGKEKRGNIPCNDPMLSLCAVVS